MSAQGLCDCEVIVLYIPFFALCCTDCKAQRGFVRKGREEVSSSIIIITVTEQISRLLVVTEERVED